ncbi:cellulose synthase complex outer membrane protein BcsC [Fluoribacter dumoffii]|uniref:cellulose synthase complex outer membrane protein BcsC n=1 Tax=Fluoribacter dumoffii TaxID=463 RepID=UPI0022444757|nr:cellulose synthase complex outer membrane protein BcsC [Fluoribacter dumoffii]MCW8384930.1 cellulose synthase complex outer membrane protein BcsC [Fluoribacter dumoffii]MCW8417991.1 cellulose synthase complex outer membrane protein BcsC [Fluoribacter dumoffii]MCW8454167.1 cellulose synthase complex outer membrane protein BcsC [Fluoribacter dumoffii]MCW8461759.1 cellulose synthase complex outer membrane protein BcsC [Fluoribacter dumoffii]MCW8481975.1 cellulose synthase complex outer membran
MLKTRFGLVFLSLIALNTFADDFNPKKILLDQVIWGETYYRDDFVKNSLDRLQLIAPDDPEVLAARIRLAIRQKNLVLAKELLNELKQKAPGSDAYKQAQMSLLLTEPDARQKLQQARIMAMSGHIDLAKTQYDALFHGDFPTPELSSEYWRLVSYIPAQRQNAFNHLQILYNFLNSHKIYSDHDNQDNWAYGLKERLSGLWVANGDLAFRTGNMDVAKKRYQQAILLDSSNYFAWVGLGEVEFFRKNFVQAEKAYKQALVVSPGKSSAVYGLIGVYKRESLKKALDYIDSLPGDLKSKFTDLRLTLESSLFQEQAEQFENKNLWQQAITKYSQAYKLDPNDVWLVYHYAVALNHVGNFQKANELFQKLSSTQKNNPTQAYAYALFLSSIEKSQQALNQLQTIPQKQWDENMRQLAQRLITELILEHAQQLRDSGESKAAIDYLMHQTQTIPIKLTLAEWALNDGDFATALNYYQDVKALDPLNADANLGVIESLIALGNKKKAHQLLEEQQKINLIYNVNMQRRLANAWTSVGYPQKALTIFNRIKLESMNVPPSLDSSLIFRDAARLETQLRMPKLAKEDYKKAMVQSNITSIWPSSNDYYTYLTRNHLGDDWLKRSIRSDAALLYKQQETRVTVDQDYWRLTGTAGISDLRAQDTITQADWGYLNGRAYFRTDAVGLSAGSFTTDSDGLYFSDFGTCAIDGCSTGIAQRANGLSWDGGWQNPVWGFDIGETPIGFPVTNFIGGINYSGEFRHIGWTLTASQRPMTNSLLSFAGAVDPNTGVTWGGVVATGLTLSLSYDRGEANGFWASIVGSELTGENVPSNQRILLFDGYYHKFINEDNRRFILGLNNMVWHYDKNLYGFNLGQGGYYSPNFYLSFTTPIDYRKRTANWSYELGGTLIWSYATTKNLLDYPLPNAIPNFDPAENSIQTGGNSTGYGYSLLALVERRLGSHFMVGGFVNIQQSTDYTPSNLVFFLRYSLEGWQGDMDMPIIPLVPYSTFR